VSEVTGKLKDETNLRSSQILTFDTFTIRTTEDRALETFTIFLQATAFLAIASRHVTSFDTNFHLESRRVSLSGQLNCFLSCLQRASRRGRGGKRKKSNSQFQILCSYCNQYNYKRSSNGAQRSIRSICEGECQRSREREKDLTISGSGTSCSCNDSFVPYLETYLIALPLQPRQGSSNCSSEMERLGIFSHWKKDPLVALEEGKLICLRFVSHQDERVLCLERGSRL
jgi:hypothetical protein